MGEVSHQYQNANQSAGLRRAAAVRPPPLEVCSQPEGELRSWGGWGLLSATWVPFPGLQSIHQSIHDRENIWGTLHLFLPLFLNSPMCR